MGSRVLAHGFGLRVFVVGVGVAVLGAGVAALPAVASPAVAEVPGSAPDELTALRYAEARGEPVVVESATTETDEVKANPDGTLTLVQHLRPVRVKRADGWVPVDLTLERRADGTFGPKAAPVDVVFSPGGAGSADDVLARVVRGEFQVGLGWGRDLPDAVVDGTSLTYPEVLPGVDLKVEARLDGFGEVLVVKTPQAAENSELDRITFTTHARGVRVEDGPEPGGDLVARDGTGTPVFSGDASLMWDSSGSAEDDPAGGPVEGDRTAEMGVEVTPGTVAVTPDREFLADPTTTYPVSIDPEYHCGTCGKLHHVVVQDQWPEDRNFDVTVGKLGDLKAGFLNASLLEAPNNGKSRSYLQMHTAPIINRFIHRATLRTTVIHTYSCAPSPTQLYLSPWVDANTSWSNQPGWHYLLSESNVANNADNCPGAGGADFDATRGVRQAANEGWTSTPFLLQAKHEDQLDTSWRRFALNPHLEVVYNSWPYMPTALGMEGWGPQPSNALPCVSGVGRAAVFTRTPRLRARMRDPDGGMMDAMFRVINGVGPGITGGTDYYTNGIPSESYAEVTVPATRITSDGLYTWRVWGSDHGLMTGSMDCEVEVDSVAPRTPLVSSTDYPTTTGAHGSVGRTGLFTIRVGANTGLGGTMDVRRYGWSLNDDTAITNTVAVTSADGTMTVPITPTRAGVNVLYLTAFDRAGNRSATNAVYAFTVAEPADLKAGWALDEAGGTTAADSTGRHPLTVTGGAAFAAGYWGNGLALTGGTATSAGPVVDTSRAFSVSTWVKLSRTDGYFTAVSQDGNSASSFLLGYSQDLNRWTMSAPQADSATALTARAASTAPPQVEVWTHLLGTYEPNSGLKLYVNGKLQGTAAVTTWNARGGFVVGAAKWGTARTNHFHGKVDRTRVWDRVLSAAQAAGEANFAVLRAHYMLDERSGTTTLDRVSGLRATLAGGVVWAGQPNTTSASEEKWLNFSAAGTGEVNAPRPTLFHTNRSYTVTAWVRHSGAAGVRRVAVSSDDTQFSPFTLGYNGSRWEFSASQSATTANAWAARSDEEPVPGRWVHLAATYDAVSGRISLYVDGVRQTTFSGTTADGGGVTGRDATGGVKLGRATAGGTRSAGWAGDVDDVRIFSGVLTGPEILHRQSSTQHH